ncbi:hypothetical protein IWW36_005695, partial [Coemansia brasiliensis]
RSRAMLVRTHLLLLGSRACCPSTLSCATWVVASVRLHVLALSPNRLPNTCSLLLRRLTACVVWLLIWLLTASLCNAISQSSRWISLLLSFLQAFHIVGPTGPCTLLKVVTT